MVINGADKGGCIVMDKEFLQMKISSHVRGSILQTDRKQNYYEYH